MWKAAERILAHAYAGIRNISRRREHNQLGAALVDVMLRAGGGHTRRLRDDLNVLLERIRAAAKVIGLRLDDEPGLAIGERGCLLLAHFEPPRLGWRLPAPEQQPVGGLLRVENRM